VMRFATQTRPRVPSGPQNHARATRGRLHERGAGRTSAASRT
jgi:hypothetical protein